MSYNIKIAHTAPTFKQFSEWGIQRAFPTFYIDIGFHKDEKEELYFKIEITGSYYCCGSVNFEDINMKIILLKHNNMNQEQFDKLLEDANLEKIIEQSIKNSMIPNDPVGILELMYDNILD